MDSQDIIDRAYSILRDQGICRRAYARDAHGENVPVTDPEATTFCAIGAIGRATFELGMDYHDVNYIDAVNRVHALVAAQTDIGLDAVQVTSWNDNFARDEEILSLFARAATPTMQETLALV